MIFHTKPITAVLLHGSFSVLTPPASPIHYSGSIRQGHTLGYLIPNCNHSGRRHRRRWAHSKVTDSLPGCPDIPSSGDIKWGWLFHPSSSWLRTVFDLLFHFLPASSFRILMLPPETQSQAVALFVFITRSNP